MRACRIVTALAVVLLYSADTLLAAFPDPLKWATHITTGRVERVFHFEEPSRQGETYQFDLVQVIVEKVEKGKRLKAGDVIYAEFITHHAPLSGSRVSPVPPTKGEHIRLFLTRAPDGKYQVLANPKAMERTSAPSVGTTPETPSVVPGDRSSSQPLLAPN